MSTSLKIGWLLQVRIGCKTHSHPYSKSLDQLSQVSHKMLISKCVSWDPLRRPLDHSTTRRSAILYGRSPLNCVSWNAHFTSELKTAPRRTMNWAVELAFTVATSWELSCRRASSPFSPGTQALKQELKFHPVYFGLNAYSETWKIRSYPMTLFLQKKVLTVMSNPIPGAIILFCSPNFSLQCQFAAPILFVHRVSVFW